MFRRAKPRKREAFASTNAKPPWHVACRAGSIMWKTNLSRLTAAAFVLSAASGCGDERGGARDAAADAWPDAGASNDSQADVPTRDAVVADVHTGDVATGDAATSDAAMVDDAGLRLGLPHPIRLGVAQSMSQACGIAADVAGNVYVVGQTNGSLWGSPPLGRRDLFLARVRASGALEWVRHIGDGGTGLGIFAGGCAGAARGARSVLRRAASSSGFCMYSRSIGSAASRRVSPMPRTAD